MDFGKPLETGEPIKCLPSEVSGSGGMSSSRAVANAVMEHGQIIPCQDEGGPSVQEVIDLARPDPEKLNLEAGEGVEGDAKKPSSSSSNVCMDASSPGEAVGICQNPNCQEEILALRRQNEEMKTQMKEKDWMIATYDSFWEKVGKVIEEEEKAFQAFEAAESEESFGASPAKISRSGN